MIQVNIATQNHRGHNIQKIIDALNEQSLKPDKIVVIFQGYRLPLQSDIEVAYVNNYQNKGAIERFSYLGKEINLIIDDDFIPSKEYVKTAMEGLKRNPDSFCSFWGFKTLPTKNYFSGWKNIESWFDLEKDERCIRLGCGLSIWDESKLNLGYVNFEHENFNDMQIAIYCAKNRIKMFCIAHKGEIALHLADERTQSKAIWKDEVDNAKILQEFNTTLLTIFES